jgi:hypothetical protein
MKNFSLPRVFIGSSSEALKIAYALQTSLEYDSEPTVWTQGIFKPSSTTLRDLVASIYQFDFAVFVFSPDDVLTMRTQTVSAVRDNVLFELGLLMGRLGMERCFILKARDSGQLHLPTDLIGLQPLEFHAQRTDGNLVAALGPCAHQLRSEFAAHGKTLSQIAQLDPSQQPSLRNTLERYFDLWNSGVLRADREQAEKGIATHVMDDDDGRDGAILSRLKAFAETVCDSCLRGEISSDELDTRLGKEIRAIYSHDMYFWYNAPNRGEPSGSPIIEAWLESRKKTKSK